MTSDHVEAESKVSGTRAIIPDRIRRELGIEDGDQLRWQIEADGSVRIEVVSRQMRTFADFEGYDGDTVTDAASEHDTWGVDADELG
ncbi:MAG TPA: AbrB/MazE/SpoVT family DNA-binding domain-containing protein [Natronoarchaeum rubrum]|nr:AbrB/MazE/SpoVT family DNA-binding domain-containing protein [Natronoarchaeum rubrum]